MAAAKKGSKSLKNKRTRFGKCLPVVKKMSAAKKLSFIKAAIGRPKRGSSRTTKRSRSGDKVETKKAASAKKSAEAKAARATGTKKGAKRSAKRRAARKASTSIFGMTPKEAGKLFKSSQKDAHVRARQRHLKAQERKEKLAAAKREKIAAELQADLAKIAKKAGAEERKAPQASTTTGSFSLSGYTSSVKLPSLDSIKTAAQEAKKAARKVVSRARKVKNKAAAAIKGKRNR